MASRIEGERRLKRKLRNMPSEVRAPIKREMIRGTVAIRFQALRELSRYNVRSGDLVNSIKRGVSRDGLSARVGQTTRASRRKAFYLQFFEVGARGVGRPPAGRRKGTGEIKKTQPLGSAFDAEKDILARNVKRAVRVALRRAVRR